MIESTGAAATVPHRGTALGINARSSTGTLMKAVALLAVAVTSTFAPGLVRAVSPSPAPHPVEFWRAIRDHGYAPPDGEDTGALALELSDLLASPDPELRDDIAYGTLAAWIYQKPVLSDRTLRGLVARLTDSLRTGIGEHDTDTVFRRSFSALVLSVIVARDNIVPVLSDDEFARILNAGLEYLAAEQDVRGYDAAHGWMHSAAHTADLLKFASRSRRLPGGGQTRVLDGIAAKLASAPVVFVNGEDERFARAILSVVNRQDFDADGFSAWVTRVKPAAMKARPAVAELRSAQNIKNLYAKLEVLLATSPDSGPTVAARSALRAALKDMF